MKRITLMFFVLFIGVVYVMAQEDAIYFNPKTDIKKKETLNFQNTQEEQFEAVSDVTDSINLVTEDYAYTRRINTFHNSNLLIHIEESDTTIYDLENGDYNLYVSDNTGVDEPWIAYPNYGYSNPYWFEFYWDSWYSNLWYYNYWIGSSDMVDFYYWNQNQYTRNDAVRYPHGNGGRIVNPRSSATSNGTSRATNTVTRVSTTTVSGTTENSSRKSSSSTDPSANTVRNSNSVSSTRTSSSSSNSTRTGNSSSSGNSGSASSRGGGNSGGSVRSTGSGSSSGGSIRNGGGRR